MYYYSLKVVSHPGHAVSNRAAKSIAVTLCRASRKQQILQPICQKLPIHQNSASIIPLYSVSLLAILEHKESGKGLQAIS